MERSRRTTPSREDSPPSGFLDLPSRRKALNSLAATFRPEVAGPVLVTGESGAGKTRLWNRLADELPGVWRFAVVTASPALGPVDFLGLAAAQLGAAGSDRLAANRLAIASALRDEEAEGRSWALVVENAHHASPDVLSEIEALCEASTSRGRSGFSAVLIVGRTELVRRLASRPLRAFAGRLAAHVHLPPLDVAEAAQLLASTHVGPFDPPEIEELHRDAAGNPRSLLRLAGPRALDRPSPRPQAHPAEVESLPPKPAALQAETQPPAPAPILEAAPQAAATAERVPAAGPVLDAPPLVPSRPPLREEDGLIEVGWSGSLEAEGNPANESDEPDEAPELAAGPIGEEAIEDRYAALQAWTEWARNRGRLNPAADPTDEPVGDAGEAPEEVDAPALGTAVGSLGADVRVESEHEHAPYSQLFTRLKQSS
jgi:general secretion pathway protein A